MSGLLTEWSSFSDSTPSSGMSVSCRVPLEMEMLRKENGWLMWGGIHDIMGRFFSVPSSWVPLNTSTIHGAEHAICFMLSLAPSSQNHSLKSSSLIDFVSKNMALPSSPYTLEHSTKPQVSPDPTLPHIASEHNMVKSELSLCDLNFLHLSSA